MNPPPSPELALLFPDRAFPVMEKARLRELLEGDPVAGADFLREIFHLYRTETQPHLDKLAQAWAAGQAITVRTEAHFLAGCSANFGFKRLSTWLQNVEACARSSQLPPFPEFATVLVDEWREACAAGETALVQGQHPGPG